MPKEKHYLQIPLNYGAPRSKNVRCAGGALRVALCVYIPYIWQSIFLPPLLPGMQDNEMKRKGLKWNKEKRERGNLHFYAHALRSFFLLGRFFAARALLLSAILYLYVVRGAASRQDARGLCAARWTSKIIQILFASLTHTKEHESL